MTLDYSDKGKLKVDMRDYIRSMEREWPYEIKKESKPWNGNLFKIDKNSKPLSEEVAKICHRFIMKNMFLCKRGRSDVEVGISFLSGRVREPTEQDFRKLSRIINFLVTTIDDVTTLDAHDSGKLCWYIDASFDIHAENMRSHNGSMFTMGKGSIINGSAKQRKMARSSTEAELNAVDERLSHVIWTKRFIENQNFNLKLNILFQDNTSNIKLLENGKESSGKRTRHFNIRLFYATDLINEKEVTVTYCPTDRMWADYDSKPLVGAKFKLFRDMKMNLSDRHHLAGQQECVGELNNNKRLQGESNPGPRE